MGAFFRRWWRVIVICLGALVSVVVSATAVEYFAVSVQAIPQTSPGRWTLSATPTIRTLWLLSYLIPILLVGFCVQNSFRRQLPRAERLWVIAASYFAIIFSAAGIYYSISFAGDHDDSVSKYFYYHDIGASIPARDIARVPPISDKRAFRGVDSRFWSGVDWQAPAGASPPLRPGEVVLSVEDIVVVASYPLDQVVRFLPESRLSVAVDSFHLSVITMTTVGYGDIAPRTARAKLATDTQAILSIVLLVLALQIALSPGESTRRRVKERPHGDNREDN